MQNLNTYILVFLGVWLLVISLFMYQFFVIYKKLTKSVGGEDIKKILSKILAKGETNTTDIKELIKRVENIESRNLDNIQKVGLVRFNPFSELGGDHSFSLAILNDKDCGVVITGLHTRDRTRVYVKDVNSGKSNLELSKEEKEAIVKAQKANKH